MKILLANENRGRGGAERFTQQLALALAGAGHQVTLACRADSWLAGQGFDNLLLSYRGELDPGSLLTLLRRHAQPEVVHCQATRDLALFGSVRRWFWRRARLLKSEHSFLDSRGSAWLRWSYRQCQAVVPVSHCLKDQMRALLGDLPYRVIPNAMELPALRPPPPPRMREHTWLGYLGGLLESKRVRDVVTAAAPILRSRTDTRLLLAGEGPESQSLKELAASLEVAEQVWMPGHVDDPLPYLAGLRVLIQASPRETFSLVALEAMALEVPVVGYKRDGLAELVVDGRTGLLAEVLDAAELTRLAETYLSDEELRRAHGENGRRRVEQHFTWPMVLPLWEAAYSGVAAAPDGPAG